MVRTMNADFARRQYTRLQMTSNDNLNTNFKGDDMSLIGNKFKMYNTKLMEKINQKCFETFGTCSRCSLTNLFKHTVYKYTVGW